MIRDVFTPTTNSFYSFKIELNIVNTPLGLNNLYIMFYEQQSYSFISNGIFVLNENLKNLDLKYIMTLILLKLN